MSKLASPLRLPGGGRPGGDTGERTEAQEEAERQGRAKVCRELAIQLLDKTCFLEGVSAETAGKAKAVVLGLA